MTLIRVYSNFSIFNKFCIMTTILTSIIHLFVEGGYLGMSVITVLLTLIFFAAWKAPAWVENIGRIAFAVGLIWAFAGLRQALDYLSSNPDTPMAIIYRGLKVTLIPAIYGTIVYVVSQIIVIFQKPRL